MPAIWSDFRKILSHEAFGPICPMCEQQISIDSVKVSEDPQEEYKAMKALMKESTGDDDEAEGDDDEDEGAMMA